MVMRHRAGLERLQRDCHSTKRQSWFTGWCFRCGIWSRSCPGGESLTVPPPTPSPTRRLLPLHSISSPVWVVKITAHSQRRSLHIIPHTILQATPVRDAHRLPLCPPVRRVDRLTPLRPATAVHRPICRICRSQSARRDGQQDDGY